MALSEEEGLRLVREYGAADRWLAVLVTLRPDGQPSVSVVNAGVLPHPTTGAATVAFVARGGTAKLANLRRDPHATLVFRAGWEWVAVRGATELAGPDDPLPGIGPDRLPGLLRDIYHAAGGHHSDLAEYDRAMAEERRTAVLLRPARFTTNPSGTEHQEHG
ncbi:TIGR03618 family F420-dependent PPOX class oxidoreductase [Nonomuraea rhodomycinica]|uniref:TIGR03618 family F420-dependent PPOX class oxidoreductase n=1 Tax=Nonomuraea rhodomycinica TaxID=1712872 RepID=A0A7Y6IQU0_9ACTN|nr:TIGR03618 family F420-dependent PPOX class oxidoreductase [Nonomuraea rhodomycinica]NUW42704.1 TIGR03618 family F420-dependent PPOX class oxidoreductase [Nonomuraea rhodomycinica]